MNLITIKLLSALLILLVSIIAAWFPFKNRWQNKRFNFAAGEALAAGVFLGAGLIHMLGDAAKGFILAGYEYPVPFLLAGITFLLLLLLEHISLEFTKSDGLQSPTIAILAVVMLSIHSLLAGAALGVSYTLAQTLIVLFAILAHKWAASFALAVTINQSDIKLKTGIIYFCIFALMAPLGVLIGTDIIHRFIHYPIIEPIFDSLAAGTFIYIGTLHGLKRSVMVDRCCNFNEAVWVIVGFCLMAVVAIWV